MAMAVTKNSTMGEIVSKYPAAVPVMLRYGLHCIGCHVAVFETLEQGAKMHGMSEAEIKKMLKEIDRVVKEKRHLPEKMPNNQIFERLSNK